jgi:hypothetical protein
MYVTVSVLCFWRWFWCIVLYQRVLLVSFIGVVGFAVLVWKHQKGFDDFGIISWLCEGKRKSLDIPTRSNLLGRSVRV